MLVQLGMFAPDTATVPAVYLQLRTWCKACRQRHAAGQPGACNRCTSETHKFETVPACAAWLLSGTTDVSEALVMQQDADGRTALVAGGYIGAMRLWATPLAETVKEKKGG